jgi:hypothetical protein
MRGTATMRRDRDSLALKLLRLDGTGSSESMPPTHQYSPRLGAELEGAQIRRRKARRRDYRVKPAVS